MNCLYHLSSNFYFLGLNDCVMILLFPLPAQMKVTISFID